MSVNSAPVSAWSGRSLFQRSVALVVISQKLGSRERRDSSLGDSLQSSGSLFGWCLRGHELENLGNAIHPRKCAAYDEWHCEGVGCRNNSLKLRFERYHCAPCSYDICSRCLAKAVAEVEYASPQKLTQKVKGSKILGTTCETWNEEDKSSASSSSRTDSDDSSPKTAPPMENSYTAQQRRRRTVKELEMKEMMEHHLVQDAKKGERVTSCLEPNPVLTALLQREPSMSSALASPAAPPATTLNKRLSMVAHGVTRLSLCGERVSVCAEASPCSLATPSFPGSLRLDASLTEERTTPSNRERMPEKAAGDPSTGEELSLTRASAAPSTTEPVTNGTLQGAVEPTAPALDDRPGTSSSRARMGASLLPQDVLRREPSPFSPHSNRLVNRVISQPISPSTSDERPGTSSSRTHTRTLTPRGARSRLMPGKPAAFATRVFGKQDLSLPPVSALAQDELVLGAASGVAQFLRNDGHSGLMKRAAGKVSQSSPSMSYSRPGSRSCPKQLASPRKRCGRLQTLKARIAVACAGDDFTNSPGDRSAAAFHERPGLDTPSFAEACMKESTVRRMKVRRPTAAEVRAATLARVSLAVASSCGITDNRAVIEELPFS